MPRPDLASIGVGYRRIPILSIGKEIYCDSRLIISKLEAFYPENNLAPSTPAELGVQKLLESYTVDGGVFGNAVRLIPYWPESSLLKDEAFLDDRQKLIGGGRMTTEAMAAGRPDGLQHIRQVFDLLETTFLADGRDWILGSKEPTVADINAVWPFEWMILDRGMQESLPEEYVSEKIYPKVYAWVRRFMSRVGERKKAHSKPTTLDGETMASRTKGGASMEDNLDFIDNDPIDVKRGDEVEVFPSDYGQSEKSIGTLVGLSIREVVIKNRLGLQLHFPRWNFSIKKVPSSVSRSVHPSSPKTIPKMRLIYHPLSPFVRKVFMLAHELGLTKHIALERAVVCPIHIIGWSDNNAEVSVYNPMAKIPCLVSDDVPDGIFDSKVICDYLEHLASVNQTRDARYWKLRTLHACADGIMDAAVLITYEVLIRKERGLYFGEWMGSQRQKILRALDRLEAAAKQGILQDLSPAPASAHEAAVAVAVAMAGSTPFLSIDWKDGRASLQKWMVQWEQRKSFIETPAGEKDWEGADTQTISRI
ncbi:hypothetical protein GQ44DRAFT_704946 [Phaeosphaeriaceae sp. PMI808]|nr:hypothetical protein GQ44DRAFT_704946 [Phaeosphaeriaceae sp. PMI808]